jgi:hypothetical protein
MVLLYLWWVEVGLILHRARVFTGVVIQNRTMVLSLFLTYATAHTTAFEN